MPNTPDPRRFWGVTRIALVPSLWWENQPAVAYEAMINGIPVIASDRGGTPETLGESGFLLPLPERLTPESETLPTAEEVEPWIETIIRLWDDRALYEDQSAGLGMKPGAGMRTGSGRSMPHSSATCPQPGPPFLPRLGREASLWS
jgi:glycosyltransferase involved in cell wall biosynthesis